MFSLGRRTSHHKADLGISLRLETARLKSTRGSFWLRLGSIRIRFNRVQFRLCLTKLYLVDVSFGCQRMHGGLPDLPGADASPLIWNLLESRC